jgi:hypothetical protein
MGYQKLGGKARKFYKRDRNQSNLLKYVLVVLMKGG